MFIKLKRKETITCINVIVKAERFGVKSILSLFKNVVYCIQTNDDSFMYCMKQKRTKVVKSKFQDQYVIVKDLSTSKNVHVLKLAYPQLTLNGPVNAYMRQKTFEDLGRNECFRAFYPVHVLRIFITDHEVAT